MSQMRYGKELPENLKGLQLKYKHDLVQPFTKKGERNVEFIKRYGEDFYKKKEIKVHAEEQRQTTRRIILRRSKGSVFAGE